MSRIAFTLLLLAVVFSVGPVSPVGAASDGAVAGSPAPPNRPLVITVDKSHELRQGEVFIVRATFRPPRGNFKGNFITLSVPLGFVVSMEPKGVCVPSTMPEKLDLMSAANRAGRGIVVQCQFYADLRAGQAFTVQAVAVLLPWMPLPRRALLEATIVTANEEEGRNEVSFYTTRWIETACIYRARRTRAAQLLGGEWAIPPRPASRALGVKPRESRLLKHLLGHGDVRTAEGRETFDEHALDVQALADYDLPDDWFFDDIAAIVTRNAVKSSRTQLAMERNLKDAATFANIEEPDDISIAAVDPKLVRPRDYDLNSLPFAPVINRTSPLLNEVAFDAPVHMLGSNLEFLPSRILLGPYVLRPYLLPRLTPEGFADISTKEELAALRNFHNATNLTMIAVHVPRRPLSSQMQCPAGNIDERVLRSALLAMQTTDEDAHFITGVLSKPIMMDLVEVYCTATPHGWPPRWFGLSWDQSMPVAPNFYGINITIDDMPARLAVLHSGAAHDVSITIPEHGPKYLAETLTAFVRVSRGVEVVYFARESILPDRRVDGVFNHHFRAMLLVSPDHWKTQSTVHFVLHVPVPGMNHHWEERHALRVIQPSFIMEPAVGDDYQFNVSVFIMQGHTLSDFNLTVSWPTKRMVPMQWLVLHPRCTPRPQAHVYAVTCLSSPLTLRRVDAATASPTAVGADEPMVVDGKVQEAAAKIHVFPFVLDAPPYMRDPLQVTVTASASNAPTQVTELTAVRRAPPKKPIEYRRIIEQPAAGASQKPPTVSAPVGDSVDKIAKNSDAAPKSIFEADEAAAPSGPEKQPQGARGGDAYSADDTIFDPEVEALLAELSMVGSDGDGSGLTLDEVRAKYGLGRGADKSVDGSASRAAAAGTKASTSPSSSPSTSSQQGATSPPAPATAPATTAVTDTSTATIAGTIEMVSNVALSYVVYLVLAVPVLISCMRAAAASNVALPAAIAAPPSVAAKPVTEALDGGTNTVEDSPPLPATADAKARAPSPPPPPPPLTTGDATTGGQPTGSSLILAFLCRHTYASAAMPGASLQTCFTMTTTTLAIVALVQAAHVIASTSAASSRFIGAILSVNGTDEAVLPLITSIFGSVIANVARNALLSDVGASSAAPKSTVTPGGPSAQPKGSSGSGKKRKNKGGASAASAGGATQPNSAVTVVARCGAAPALRPEHHVASFVFVTITHFVIAMAIAQFKWSLETGHNFWVHLVAAAVIDATVYQVFVNGAIVLHSAFLSQSSDHDGVDESSM